MEYSETHLRFFQLLERLKRLDWSKQFYSIRPPEYLALYTLNHYHREHPDVPGMYVSAFAKKLKVPAPAASKLLNVLEDNGWAVRLIDPASRRNTFIQITEEGNAVFERESAFCAEKGSRIFQRMGTENVETLLTSVDQIVTLLEEEFR